MEILNSCSDSDEIQFVEDGNWAPMRSKKEVQEVSGSYNGVDSGKNVGVLPDHPTLLHGCCFVGLRSLCFSLDSGRTDSSDPKHGSSHDNKKVDVIDLTLDSSSEEELDDEPPAKRPCPSLSPQSPPATKG